jgi:3-hydroxyacyl-[acyl-carrier-protein] dehydratase
MNSMEIHEILEYLPHRYPFLLVDRVLECEEGKHIVALKNVTINEPFFPGHFPSHPIMPGVLVIEAMAQAAAILAFKTGGRTPGQDMRVYFLGIDDARFKKPVVPGDQLRMVVKIDRFLKGVWKFSATAWVGETLVTEAKMMCTMREKLPSE